MCIMAYLVHKCGLVVLCLVTKSEMLDICVDTGKHHLLFVVCDECAKQNNVLRYIYTHIFLCAI
jgi:hypothetical protein